MTNEEIDAKIKTLQGMLAEETDVTTLRTINRCIERALAAGVDTVLLAGDFLNLDAFSHFGKDADEFQEQFEAEIEMANLAMRTLEENFRRIYYIRGNHDARLSKATAGQMGMWTLERLLGQPRKLQVTEKQWCIIKTGEKDWDVRVTHPNRGRMVPLSWARTVSGNKLQHLLMAHSHQAALGWAPNGAMWVVDTGCCVDPTKLHYVWKTDTPIPDPKNGAAIVHARKGRAVPELLTPELTLWE